MALNSKSSGFSIPELLIAVAILSTIVMAIGTMDLQLLKHSKDSTSTLHLDVYRRNLSALISTQSSWNASILANANGGLFPRGKMECLKPSSTVPCTVDGSPNGTPIQNQPFALVDAMGTLYFDATNPLNGLTQVGANCARFNQTDVEGNCPFRYQLRWSAVCTPGNCLNPQIRVTADLQVNTTVKITMNPAKYALPPIIK